MPVIDRSRHPRALLAAALLAVVSLVFATPVATAAPDRPEPTPTPSGMNSLGMSPNESAAVAIIEANEEAAFDYFVGKGLTPVQAAGVVGNLDQESGMDPTIHQIGGGPGRGIAQWSAGGRWDTYPDDNVVDFAAGADPYGLQVQLDFIWFELTEYSYYGLAELEAATTIEAAVVAFQDEYEGCGTCHTDRRLAFAQTAYGKYA